MKNKDFLGVLVIMASIGIGVRCIDPGGQLTQKTWGAIALGTAAMIAHCRKLERIDALEEDKADLEAKIERQNRALREYYYDALNAKLSLIEAQTEGISGAPLLFVPQSEKARREIQAEKRSQN